MSMILKDISDLVICSDLHIYDWPDNNQELRRTKALLNWFEDLVVEANLKGKRVLLCGDLLHNPTCMSNKLFELVSPIFKRLNKRVQASTVLAITGNHDRDGDDWKLSPSWVNSLSQEYEFIRCIDFKVWPVGNDYVVCGIPYIKGNVGIINASRRLLNIADGTFKGRTKILMIHTDLPGAVDTTGIEIKSYDNISPKVSEFFSGWDYVFSGHIHKPQLIRPNIIMIGSPMQTRVSDMGCMMGHWQTDSKGKLSLVPSGLPEYRYEGEEGSDEDIYIKKVIHKVTDRKNKDKKVKVNLSDWSNLIDEYCEITKVGSKKEIDTVKEIINSRDLL